MRSLILIVAAVLIAACASTPKPVAPDEIYADILVVAAAPNPVVEVSFYGKTRSSSNRMEYSKDVLSIEEPKLNNKPLNPDPDKPGAQSYKAAAGGGLNLTVVSAKVNGKTFEGRGQIDTTEANRTTTITMIPK